MSDIKPKIKTAEIFGMKYDPQSESFGEKRLKCFRTYDENGKLTEQIEYRKNIASSVYRYQYDESGNEISNVIYEYDDDMVFKTRKEYNAKNEQVHEYTDVFSEDENVGYFQFYYRYNVFGQLIEFVEDNYGSISVETYEYIFKGNLAIEIIYLEGVKYKENIREDFGNKVVERNFIYDKLTGQLSKTEETILYFDSEKLLIRSESGDSVTEFVYDEFGNVIEEITTSPVSKKCEKTVYTFY